MKNYVTNSGDTWDLISFHLYGDERRVNELIDANLDHVETLVFSSGIRLSVPDIPQESINDSLPPWKRGTEDAGQTI
ncbi:phage tail protein [Bacillus infantis]|uniref:Phage tail protein n=1 Tax=Bacillus infantis TaxID=324767 RepID=A0A5D4SWJ4_9BACI|nr:tail protein X [Bacillus infantis]TYS66374.1 phage tail protein [Bacillus infantis]